MAQLPKDFEVLYSDDDGKIRANANLPGQLVYLVTKLTNHAAYMEKSRAALEKEHPGYEKEHEHAAACADEKTPCGKWNWRDYGIPDGWNPVKDLITPYCQFSRAEAMKGSEQVVRSFQGSNDTSLEGVGLAPDLTPRQRKEQAGKPTSIVLVAQNGAAEIGAAKKQVGLGKRLLGMGGR